jgi:hypothetical protein
MPIGRQPVDDLCSLTVLLLLADAVASNAPYPPIVIDSAAATPTAR